jgi:hypothetical protein
MSNKITLILLFTLGLLKLGLSQESDLFQLWPDTTLAKANSGISSEFLSNSEKEVVYYINLCRINPPLFAESILTDYLKTNDIKKDKEVKDLIKQLEETDPKEILQVEESLTTTARLQAKDMGETGRTGHNSSNGKSFKERTQNIANVFNGINENANYGMETALGIVVDLLIDRNVPNVGHRKNILDAEMRYIGVAIEPHKRYGINCVQDFGGIKR